jgi:hypothetical protein
LDGRSRKPKEKRKKKNFKKILFQEDVMTLKKKEKKAVMNKE